MLWRSATRAWWDNYALRYELCTSRYVLAELAAAPPAKARAGASLLAGVAVLSEPPGVHDLCRLYTEQKVMLRGAEGDAMHLAFASLHGCDFLLTWNCKHLANANKVRHLAVLHARVGLAVPVMTTPYALVPEEP